MADRPPPKKAAMPSHQASNDPNGQRQPFDVSHLRSSLPAYGPSGQATGKRSSESAGTAQMATLPERTEQPNKTQNGTKPRKPRGKAAKAAMEDLYEPVEPAEPIRRQPKRAAKTRAKAVDAPAASHSAQANIQQPQSYVHQLASPSDSYLQQAGFQQWYSQVAQPSNQQANVPSKQSNKAAPEEQPIKPKKPGNKAKKDPNRKVFPTSHTPTYLALTDPPPQQLPTLQPLLLVLDLNGTLLYRTHSNGGVNPRPGLQKFLDYCFRSHCVMVWTSARPENMEIMLHNILLDPSWRPLLATAWGRDTFGLSPYQYNKKVDVVKDLDQVWWSAAIQARHPWRHAGWSWGIGNTVLIDDTVKKAIKQPYNLIEVPEFDNTRKQVEDDGQGGGEVLNNVQAYLERLREWDNVAAYMRRWPMQF